jgi:hypothetical protein
MHRQKQGRRSAKKRARRLSRPVRKMVQLGSVDKGGQQGKVKEECPPLEPNHGFPPLSRDSTSGARPASQFHLRFSWSDWWRPFEVVWTARGEGRGPMPAMCSTSRHRAGKMRCVLRRTRVPSFAPGELALRLWSTCSWDHLSMQDR